jgi:hypothetical protein
MNAPEVVDPFGMPGIAREVSLGQLGPEAGCLNQSAGSEMIRMGIDPVMREQSAGAGASDDPGDRCSGGESCPQPAIG